MSTYNTQPELSMKWHSFLIYFSLWVGGIMNVVSGCQVLTGSHYGLSSSELEQAYNIYGSLKTVDMIFGVLMIAAGVFLIYTRFQLAGFKKGAPSKLTLAYVLQLVASLAYIFAAAGAIDVSATELMDSSTITSIITGIVMIVVNRLYYAKRAHLFGEGAYTAAPAAPTYTPSSAPSASVCPKCGAKPEAGDMFCVNCGAKLK